MYRWERRLKDLGIQLETCVNSYFKPELFRMNGNTFLTYARTITFLIQKEKANIPDFDNWYQNHVVTPWALEPIMTWAKDSRNSIEKEGDLELHSELIISLIYSHFEENDIIIKPDRRELIQASIDKLLNFAETKFPKWVSEDAVIKIERRWVATTLPQIELLQALIFIYSQHYRVCSALTKHLNTNTDPEIHDPSSFHASILGERKITYIKYSDRRSAHMKTIRQRIDPKFKPPPGLEYFEKQAAEFDHPKTLADNVNRFSLSAKSIFEHFGNHVTMLVLFDEDFNTIDGSSVMLDDRATKYIYWRSAADKIASLGASSIIWISEYWRRNGDVSKNPAWKDLPVTGEGLHVVGMNKYGEIKEQCWDIVRNQDGTASLTPSTPLLSRNNEVPNFLVPLMNAFKRTQQKPEK